MDKESSTNSDFNALSVSQALQIAKRQLENITVKIIGEVSEYSSNPKYKAIYFTVKDEKSSLPCMIWKNRLGPDCPQITIGSLVELTGRFSLYAAKGRMNFDVFSIELAGEGKLRVQVANLAKKLEAEGLMNPAMKKPVPLYPERIGLVSSPSGAAVYDVLRTLRRRYPSGKVLFAGALVEGAKAPSEIAKALHVVEDAGAEVILLVRGGGSYENLMPFNDEGLARAIFAMDVPIVTGIGHEPDTCIADMVADRRASTPTAAAETVAPSSLELASVLNGRKDKIRNIITERLSKTSMALQAISGKPIFAEPMRIIETEARYLDEALMRLTSAIPSTLANRKQRISDSRTSLKNALSNFCAPYRNYEKLMVSKLLMIGSKIFDSSKASLAARCASIEALSPLEVLNRGYSITRDAHGNICNTIKAFRANDKISVQMKDGALNCTVNSINGKEYAMEEFHD